MDFITTTNLKVTLPISPHILSLFLAHLHSKHLAPNTIKTYLSAISLTQKLQNLPDTTTSTLVTKTYQGICNLRKHHPVPSLLPITKTILHNLIDNLQYSTTTPFDFSLSRALFLLTHYACLRVGEAVWSNDHSHTLTYDSIVPVTHNQSPAYLITFTTYKHSQGATPKLLLQKVQHTQYCPVFSLTHYFALRGSQSGPLFLTQQKNPVTRQFFTSTLSKTLHQAGLHQQNYNTHSFRIGRATQLAQEGHTHSTIKSTGRWKSTAFLKYIRPSFFTLPT